KPARSEPPTFARPNNSSNHCRSSPGSRLLMINVGIVGLGFMAAAHIKAYRQLADARITAICNPSGRHLDGDFSGVAGNVGDNAPVKLDMSEVNGFRNYAEMLADPAIQLIDICAPTLAHTELAIAALNAGKH